MFKLLKILYWDLKNSLGFFRFKMMCIKDYPGNFGIALREKVYRKYFASLGINPRIHTDVRIRNIDYLKLGDYVHLGESSMIQAGGGIEIGDNTILGPGVKIWSANHKFEDADIPIREQGYEYKKVVIGKNCWIGADAFIMPGAEIGDGVIISAKAVVGAKKIPPYKILAGNPARVIGSRKTEDENKPS